jgi:hypothetical protein
VWLPQACWAERFGPVSVVLWRSQRERLVLEMD